jgi:hypothetical protein
LKVAYWELLPYFAGVTPADHTQANCNVFIRYNASKAFDHTVEVVEEARAKAGLPSISEVPVHPVCCLCPVSCVDMCPIPSLEIDSRLLT